jgi:hypothetical protein
VGSTWGRFRPDRLVNHDDEAPDLLDFGTEEKGNVVLCNRLSAEADLSIVELNIKSTFDL